jgi:hypothetical protein
MMNPRKEEVMPKATDRSSSKTLGAVLAAQAYKKNNQQDRIGRIMDSFLTVPRLARVSRSSKKNIWHSTRKEKIESQKKSTTRSWKPAGEFFIVDSGYEVKFDK